MIEQFFEEFKQKLLIISGLERISWLNKIFIKEFKEVKTKNFKKFSSSEFLQPEILESNPTINNYCDENYDLT